MSPWAFYLDFVIYPPVVLGCLYLAVRHATLSDALERLSLAAAALLAWPLIEYIAHRFVFHRIPYIKDLHEAHHNSPDSLIGTPTLVSLASVFSFVFLPVGWLLGIGAGAAISAGILLGYLGYVGVHDMTHHWPDPRLPFLRRLKRHHALHHHVSDEINFGVTTPFWDRVFGTLAPERLSSLSKSKGGPQSHP